MVPLLIGAGLIAAVALSADDDDNEQEDEDTTKRTMSENELPPLVKEKLEEKRRK